MLPVPMIATRMAATPSRRFEQDAEERAGVGRDLVDDRRWCLPAGISTEAGEVSSMRSSSSSTVKRQPGVTHR